MTRRRRRHPCGAIALGLALAGLLGMAAGFGLVLAAEATGAASLETLESNVLGLLAAAELIAPSPTPRPTPTPTAAPPSPTPFAPAAITSTPTPSPTPTETATETACPTPTDTATSTASPFPTATSTPVPTATPSATFRPAALRSPTRTRTPAPRAATEASPAGTEGSPAPGTDIPGVPVSPTAPLGPAECSASTSADMEAQVAALVNAERSGRGLDAYDVDGRLRAAARVQAADMACNHFTSHTGSDGSSVRDRVERQGYAWSWIGENYYVTRNTTTGAQTAFDWWMNSAPHRSNLLSPNYTEFGVGVVLAPDSDHGGYFVVVFARPR